ncbi:MAG: chromate resistance protein ChrB domain-containing protein [Polyangiaceae bacterium]
MSSRAQFRASTWTTRKRLWVDRVASAWLIQRFIDRDARSAVRRPSALPARPAV